MSLEQALHLAWSVCKPLCDLLPPERVFTGLVAGRLAYPYASLARVRTVESSQTSSGTLLETFEIRLRVWDDKLERGQFAAEAARRFLSRAELPWPEGVVHDVRRVNHSETQQPDGVWLLESDFHIRTSQPGDV